MKSIFAPYRESRRAAEVVFGSLIFLYPFFMPLCGQSSFSVDFKLMLPNQPLAEQFSSQGLHFFGGINQPKTVAAPEFLSPSGETVALAQNVLGLRFDYAVQGISMRVAQPGDSLSIPSLVFFAFDADDTQVSYQARSFLINQWAEVNVEFNPAQDVRRVRIEGWNMRPLSEGQPAGFYTEILQITAVPEPAAAVLFITAGAALVLRQRTLRRD
jgi:hypothetical protein